MLPYVTCLVHILSRKRKLRGKGTQRPKNCAAHARPEVASDTQYQNTTKPKHCKTPVTPHSQKPPFRNSLYLSYLWPDFDEQSIKIYRINSSKLLSKKKSILLTL